MNPYKFTQASETPENSQDTSQETEPPTSVPKLVGRIFGFTAGEFAAFFWIVRLARIDFDNMSAMDILVIAIPSIAGGIVGVAIVDSGFTIVTNVIEHSKRPEK